MKNMMSLAEIEQVMQPEVAIPLTIGIAMLMYSIFYLFSYEESTKRGMKKSKAASKRGGDAPTRRSKREPKKPKNFDEDEEEVRKRESEA